MYVLPFTVIKLLLSVVPHLVSFFRYYLEWEHNVQLN
jgi:hypothetical protein